MDENKEVLKKDLQIILQLNSKMNYTNVDAVKKLYTAITEKGIFHSSLGQRYTKKLERIIAGKDNNTCIFCGKDSTVGKIICNACLDKISTPKTEKKEDTISTIKNVTASVMSKENLDKTRETAQKALNKADEKLQNFNEKIDAKNKFATAITHLNSFWNKRTKKQKIIITCVSVILLVGMFASGGNETSSISKDSIKNSDDAKRIVSELYPESEYDIIAKQTINPAKEMFEVSVGEYCGDSWANEFCTAYVFFVQSKEQAMYSAVLWVNEDGRIVGYGSLISGLNDDITQSYPTYRIK